MAWAEKTRGGRYRGRYRDAAGAPRSVGGTFTRRRDAVAAASAEEDRQRRPGAVDPRDGRLTLAAWIDEWKPRRAVEPGTALRDESRLHRHVLPRWGDVPIDAIRREDVQAWVIALHRDGLAAWTVAHCYRLLSSALRDAVVERRLTHSPCESIRLPVPPEGTERFLTHDEVGRIAFYLAEPYRTLVLLLVGSGLRWGEAVGLHWHRVDLDDGAVDVAEVWDDKVREIKPYPKGRRSRRVWIPPWLTDALTAHAGRYPPGRCAAPHRGGARCRSGLVIPGRGGVPLSYSNFRQRHWGAAVGRGVCRVDGDPRDRTFTSPSEARRVVALRGLPVREEWRDGLAEIGPARIHDLRHTFASWALQAEQPMPLYDLSVAMGHSSMNVTMRYAHLGRSSRDRSRQALAADPTAQSAPLVHRSPRGDLPDVVVPDDGFRWSAGG